MNDKILFGLLRPAPSGNLDEQILDLRSQLALWLSGRGVTREQLVVVRVLLSDAANQWPVLREHPLCVDELSDCALSYVEQPPLDGCKLALQLCACRCGDLCKRMLPDGVEAMASGFRLLFQTVRFRSAEVADMDAAMQTREAFRRHINQLRQYGWTLADNCHRTWIYVRDVDCHYAGVVKGRNGVFAEEGLTADTHFIASTGIGGNCDNPEAIVCMDFLSFGTDSVRDVKYLQATDYLNPTAEYGVAFERGTALTAAGMRWRFISGTASIDRYGECLYRSDVMAQTERLFLNIEKLLAADGARLSD